MKKLLLMALACALMARENPFVLDVKLNEPSEVIEQSEFSKIAFSFPKDARKLINLNLEYLAADGSIKNYSIAINQRIDWHKVYMLISEEELIRPSQDAILPALANSPEASHSQMPKSAQALASDAPEANSPEALNTANKASNDELDESRRIIINDNLSFIIKPSSVQILSKAKLIRQFSLNKPDRIVLDYKLIKGLKNKTIALAIGSFKALKIGVHEGFFRVVLNSDSKYDYHINQESNSTYVKLQ